jgi:[NiFe] hydrogenase diaphorase moiety large subunit
MLVTDRERFTDELHALADKYGRERSALLPILQEVQAKHRQISPYAMQVIADLLGIHPVEVHSVVSFYAFLDDKPKGRFVIRLCRTISCDLAGKDRIARQLENDLGIAFGETTPDGKISLEFTPCIGMCDQAPAGLVNDEVVTYLSGDQARSIVRKLRENLDPKGLVGRFGDGNNAHDLVQTMVHNNIRKQGPVIFAPLERGEALKKAIAMTPQEVIRDIKTARLRGRGGAGFPTGMKWDFTRSAPGDERFIICNADEGEPGTFKDRVILTECPDLLFEGMTIAGYAIGADTGILYLRAEYAYLRAFLEHVLRFGTP